MASSRAPASPEPTARPGAAELAVEGLGKRFGRRTALRGVSFTAPAGELIALIGPNGAGKTTLLSILAGIQDPDQGTVRLPPGGVGWVPQHAALYSRLSVAENLRLFARLERVADPAASVESMLEQTGLHERAGDEVSRLSGGNRQRVNIAIGLLSEPSVLLLDEPSSALDPRQRERLWQWVGGVGERGTTVLYSTHDVQEAERHADRVLVLADGELVFSGSPSALQAEVGETGLGFEAAFVRFLAERGH